jgi:cell wall-associated NlpC family hydrolase
MITVNWTRFQFIPYRDGGRDYNGIDCWGLIYLVYRDILHIELPTYGGIGASELIAVYRQIKADKVGKDWQEIPVGEEKQFDVVVLAGTRPNEVGRLGLAEVHVGLVTQPGQIIHTEETTGCVCMNFRDGPRGRANPLVSKRVRTIHRHIGVS